MSKTIAITEENVESKSEKRIRVFLAVMYFLQVMMIPLPLMHGEVEGGIGYRTALNLLIQYNGYNSAAEVIVALYGAVLIILPVVSFFFFLLDKKSKKKYIVSVISCFLCAVIIWFGTGDTVALGGVLTLILIVVILFMTAQGFQATRMRERDTQK